jgi:hypothetical protein
MEEMYIRKVGKEGGRFFVYLFQRKNRDGGKGMSGDVLRHAAQSVQVLLSRWEMNIQL